MRCECLHFFELGPHTNKKLRLWACFECGATKVLQGTVFNWVGMSGGKWRRKA